MTAQDRVVARRADLANCLIATKQNAGGAMDTIPRRNILAAAAAGILMTAATASAQTPLPQPQRPGHGGTEPGPRNIDRDRQNPDMLVPPATDHGTLPNLRFSFSDAHMRLRPGGWER